MKIKVYQKYRGKLTKVDINEGMKRCFENASFLLDEAIKQQKNGKYNLAYYFAYTSDEEFIKVYLLLYYFVILKTEGIKKFWEYFTNHVPKKRLILFKRFMDSKGKNNITILENVYFLLKEKEYQTIRENSLYCDVVLPKKFVVPSGVFESKDTKDTIKQLRIERKKWKETFSDEKKLTMMIEYMEKNPSQFISPSYAFKKTHGMFLSDR